MAFSGSSHNRVHDFTNDENNNIDPSAERFDDEFDDISTSLETRLAKDGTNAATANLPMGGFKLTGLAAGTANGNSIRYEQMIAAQVPIGGCIDWYAELADIPSNYAYPIGQSLSRTTYEDLFALLGTKYGSDDSSTFKLPDLRGRFERNVDGGEGNDPDAASRTDRGDGTTGDNVGTLQADQVGPHTHPNGKLGAVFAGSTYDAAGGAGDTNQETGDSNGTTETRPLNIYKYSIMRLS